ncbi:hypothetical protein SNE40_000068 [Patella caerulea]|uniref:Uncharacterized protein n=1 Tax=Patella caerulea TaxID=87958 RepID=A0AAN8KBJ3_PATCE
MVDEDGDPSLTKTLLMLTEITEKMTENAKINPKREAKKEVETDDIVLKTIGSAVVQVGSAVVSSAFGAGTTAVSAAVGLGSAAVGWLKSWWSK